MTDLQVLGLCIVAFFAFIFIVNLGKIGSNCTGKECKAKKTTKKKAVKKTETKTEPKKILTLEEYAAFLAQSKG